MTSSLAPNAVPAKIACFLRSAWSRHGNCLLSVTQEQSRELMDPMVKSERHTQQTEWQRLSRKTGDSWDPLNKEV